MGIDGLHQFLKDKKVTERIKLSSLANQTVAIDGHCWLYKGAFAIADKLARGEETEVHIDYCMNFVKLLQSYKIIPILVFDGQDLPAKADVNAQRQEKRQSNKQQAEEFLRQNNFQEARKCQQKCVEITHEMVCKLIKKCREVKVDCIVAPYEADAQLTFLNKIGLAAYVLTEDSDLIVFGCQKVLSKFDKHTGFCDLVDIDKLHLSMEIGPMDRITKRYTFDKFRLMCILSGCDYIKSLRGVGLKTAQKFVMNMKQTDLMCALNGLAGGIATQDYKNGVLEARATYLHMVVYDPTKCKQVRLHEIGGEHGTNIEQCSKAGKILDDNKMALDLAVGNLDPLTFRKLDNWYPNQSNSNIWNLGIVGSLVQTGTNDAQSSDEIILRGVVFVISGIQNPKRAQMRDKAIKMGAKYESNWNSSCTHLISAFKNTPKYNQVRGQGIIVNKDWIHDCLAAKKKLPWQDYQL